MSVDTTEVICPSCGTVSHFTELARDGGAFCRNCDFPLFWARAPRGEGGSADPTDAGLRRLPGTGGRISVATIDCPACTEPNSPSATVCIRCGSDLRPVPPPPPTIVMEPEPVPVVEPEPVPPPRRTIWPWVALAVLLLLGVVALIVVLV